MTIRHTMYLFMGGCLLLPSLVFAIDTDGDGLSDSDEARYYTDPLVSDTDGDGYLDGVEIEYGYSPIAPSSIRMHEHDLDQDGLNDWVEIWFGSDLNNPDTDGDGYPDFQEVLSGYHPALAGPSRRFEREILVDRTHQQLYVVVDGIRVLRFPVSTGNPGSETPAGTFPIQRLVEVKDYVGDDYFVPDVWWNMEFLPTYYIHSAYWHHDFGVRTHSHGCVNMTIEDAKLLYQYVDVGMQVTVTGTTPVAYRVEGL